MSCKGFRLGLRGRVAADGEDGSTRWVQNFHINTGISQGLLQEMKQDILMDFHQKGAVFFRSRKILEQGYLTV